MVEFDEFKENILTQFPILRDQEILRYHERMLRESEDRTVGRGVPFIKIFDDNVELYKSIIRTLEVYLDNQFDQLVFELLKKEEEKPQDVRKVENVSYKKFRLYFYSVRDKRNVTLVLKQNPYMGSQFVRIYENTSNDENCDLCVVTLNYFGPHALEIIKKQWERCLNYKFINILDFPTFCLKYYGKEAKKNFEKVVKELNAGMDELVGYSITEICSQANMDKLKEETCRLLAGMDFSGIFSMTHFPNEVTDRLIKKFRSEQRYTILFGESDFADSFMTSEWFYQKYAKKVLIKSLDLTSVVAGYFKSVEQLLHYIVEKKCQGEYFQQYYQQEPVLIGGKEFKTTLGSLCTFLSKKQGTLFYSEQDQKLQDLFVDNLNDWRRDNRNGYFHKDNISSSEGLTAIRAATLNLYFLIFVMIDWSYDAFDEGE
jgi:hypothetical protein